VGFPPSTFLIDVKASGDGAAYRNDKSCGGKKVATSNATIEDVLGIGKGTPLWRRLWPRLLWLALAILAGLLGVLWWTSYQAASAPHYQTLPTKIGGLTVSVSATGTVSPIDQVQVGSEISGTVKSVGVDYNTHVTQGQVLAVIDADQLTAQAQRAEATLKAVEADVTNKQAVLDLAQANQARTVALAAHSVVSPQDVETGASSLHQAQAALNAAQAQVKVAEADLAADQTQLAKATIRSPIDGIVLERNVDRGQTVAASLQAPVLFTIANDLTRMELLVDIDEADAGSVKEGQHATFTVEAYPNEHFDAKVTQLRLNPQSVSGVVTYKAVMSVDNAQLLLRPGMTVAVDVTVDQVTKALLIPNAALRYTPPTAAPAGGNFFTQLFRRTGPTGQAPARTTSSANQKRVWILRDGSPVSEPVTIGRSDGTWSEMISGNVRAGDQVITANAGAS